MREWRDRNGGGHISVFFSFSRGGEFHQSDSSFRSLNWEPSNPKITVRVTVIFRKYRIYCQEEYKNYEGGDT